MARYNDDDSYWGKKKNDSDPNYTLASNQVEQRTFQQDIKRGYKGSREGSGQFTESDERKSNDDGDSNSNDNSDDSNDSQANYMDMEA
jgi:hypothetical protein